MSFTIPSPRVNGYGYSQADQAFHLEIWVEKSTQDDVLESVCTQYGVNLVTSLGFQSITSVIDLLERIRRSGKPARIFYVSDSDPAGDGMPTAVARQVEYWRQKYAPDADIALTPVALTRDQVIATNCRAYRSKTPICVKATSKTGTAKVRASLTHWKRCTLVRWLRLVRQAIAPYNERTRQGIFRAWAQEGNQELREAALHLIRGFELVEKRIADDIATGTQAAQELAYRDRENTK